MTEREPWGVDEDPEACEPRATRHARKRIRERLGIPARGVERAVRMAWTAGRTLDDPTLPPPVRLRLVAALNNERDNARTEAIVPVYYNGAVWVFTERKALLTVLCYCGDEDDKTAPKHPDRPWLRRRRRSDAGGRAHGPQPEWLE